MPPRRKPTSSTKEIELTSKADDHVSNQDDPHGFAATVKRRGRKVAIPAEEKGEADSIDLCNTKVSARSSKQKALQKILSMDREEADDCITSTRASKPKVGKTENDFSATGATADPKQSSKKKTGPRAKKLKKALETIPEDVAMEAKSVDPGLKIVSDKAKQVSELCANEEKPDRGERRGARANEIDQCKPKTQQGEEHQGNGLQQGKTITCSKASKKKGSLSRLAPGHAPILSFNQAPGNLLKKTVDSLPMPTKIPDSLSQAPTEPEPNKDQILNVRSSTRTKKAVQYNEQSPKNEKRFFVTTELKTQAATERNSSTAKLPPRGAKRVKEDPTSASEGPLGLGSARAINVKRGRRHQELSSPQNHVNNSAASRGTGNKKEFRELPEEGSSVQVISASAFNTMDLDKGFHLQTAQSESVKFLPAQQGADLFSAAEKRESDQTAHNQISQNSSLSKKSQNQVMADEQTSMDMLSMATGKCVVQHTIQDIQLINDGKKSNAFKGRKFGSKRRALPSSAQRDEGDTLPLESGDEAKPKVLEATTRRNDSSAKIRPRGVKTMKADPTNAPEETMELDSAGVTCVRRGRNQNLSSLQNRGDKKSVVLLNNRGTEEDNEEFRNSGQASSLSADSNKDSLLQTGQSGSSMKFSPPREDAKLVPATGLKTRNAGSMIMCVQRESDSIAFNQTCQANSIPENFQDQMIADKLTCLEVLSKAAGKGDGKKFTTSKGRKISSRGRALPNIAQKGEDKLPSALSLGFDEEAKPKVSEAPLVQEAANSAIDAMPEICGTHQSDDADKKLHCDSQNSRRNVSMRKRTLQGTAQPQAKKRKNSVLDTLATPTNLDTSFVGAVPVHNQEHDKAIQEVEPEGWNAVDITNLKSRVMRSSEKKRREELKRKRAMKFDALPVGFGLGISCWSTPPWAEQSTEEEEIEEVDLPVMGFLVQSKSPMEEAKKQQSLQEPTMLKDAKNVNMSEGCKDAHQGNEPSRVGLQVQLKSSMEEAKKRPRLQEIAMSNDASDASLGVLPPRSATRSEGSSFAIHDAERLPGSGLKSVPKNDLKHQQEKPKIKRQVAQKTKASKAVLVESPRAVYTGNDKSIVDKENVEPKSHAHNESELKTGRKSQRRVATAGMEKKTTRTRRN